MSPYKLFFLTVERGDHIGRDDRVSPFQTICWNGVPWFVPESMFQRPVKAIEHLIIIGRLSPCDCRDGHANHGESKTETHPRLIRSEHHSAYEISCTHVDHP